MYPFHSRASTLHFTLSIFQKVFFTVCTVLTPIYAGYYGKSLTLYSDAVIPQRKRKVAVGLENYWRIPCAIDSAMFLSFQRDVYGHKYGEGGGWGGGGGEGGCTCLARPSFSNRITNRIIAPSTNFAWLGMETGESECLMCSAEKTKCPTTFDQDCSFGNWSADQVNELARFPTVHLFDVRVKRLRVVKKTISRQNCSKCCSFQRFQNFFF